MGAYGSPQIGKYAEKEKQQHICKNCGYISDDDFEYCPKCGKSFKRFSCRYILGFRSGSIWKSIFAILGYLYVIIYAITSSESINTVVTIYSFIYVIAGIISFIFRRNYAKTTFLTGICGFGISLLLFMVGIK